MQLFLLRHAEAESNAPSDEVRALTAKGARQAEAIGKDLWERRLVALADRLRAGDQQHGGVAFEADIDVLVR